MGTTTKAAEMFQDLLSLQERVYGAEDVEYLRNTFEPACIRQEQFRHDDAEVLLKRLLEAREKVLGKECSDGARGQLSESGEIR